MSFRVKKITYSFIAVLLIAILIMPLVIGSWIKYEYDSLIAFYNSEEGIHVNVKKYERHWFSANVELEVSVNPPWVQQMARSLTAQDIPFPSPINFTVIQHIQNGPILYRKSADQSLSVQLAYMYSEIHFAPELAQVIQLVNAYEPPVIIIDNLSFNGKFQRSFRSAGFRMEFTGTDSKIELRGVNAEFSIWPNQRRVKANIKTDDFIVMTQSFEAIIPAVEIMCDRTQSAHKLWIGSSAISLSQIYLRDAQQATLSIVNAKTKGELSESGEMLNGTREFTIDKVESGDQIIGPISLHISTHNFDATMSAKIISTYGQMLFSDQYMLAAAQLLTSLPEVVNGQSSIDIEELDVATPNGHLKLDGKIDWPGLAAGSRLSEVVQHTHAKGLLRVAIPLVNRLSQAMVDLTYADQPALPASKNIADKKISAAERQNELVIAMLAESHQLPSDVATKLLLQTKKQTSLSDYQHLLDDLVASKQITADVADTLHNKYAAIQWVNMGPDERRENSLKMLQKRINNWVQEGYIIEDKNDYIARLIVEDGQVSVNGKVVHKAY